MELVLGIDLGTHGARVLAVDAQGVIHSRGVRPYERLVRTGGIQEQPLETVWSALCVALRQVLAAIIPGDRVVGLAVTHQRGTVIALDAAYQPIGSAVCDSDTRSVPQAEWLSEQVGAERLYCLTGCPPLAFNGLSKILWWREAMPQETAKIKYWASLQDWAVLKLTGQPASSPGAALRMGILDIIAPTQYAYPLINDLGLAREQLLPLLPWGHVLARVSIQASNETGLEVGTPVFAAPGDQPAAVLGTGAVAHRDAIINLGTSFLISVPTDAIVPRGYKASCTLEVLPNNIYALELGSGAGTNVLDWLCETLFELPSVDSLIAYAETSPRGARGLYVVPLWWGALNSRLSGCVHGLKSEHTRGDLVRATLEGLACEVRWIWERLCAVLEIQSEQVAVSGGASQADLLCQMLADVLERSVYRVTTSDTSALGAAMSTAVGLGWYKTIDEAARAMSALRDSLAPGAEGVKFFRQAYQRYIELRG